jgi:anti-sigma factor RsiW
MSDCDQYREKLGAYAAGMLDEPERAALERHLDACEVCRGEVQAARRTWSELDAWREADLPVDLAESAMTSFRSRRRIYRMVLPSAAAAVIALALSAWSWYRPGAGVPKGGPDQRAPMQVVLSAEDRAVVEELDFLEAMPMLAEFEMLTSAEMLRTLDKLGMIDAAQKENSL